MIGDAPDIERDPIAARLRRESESRVLIAVGAAALAAVGAIYAVGYHFQEQQVPTRPRRPRPVPKAAAPAPAPLARAAAPSAPAAAKVPSARPARRPRGPAKPRAEEPDELGDIELPQLKSYDELQADIAAEERRRAAVAEALEKARAEERERRAAERKAKGLPPDARDMSVEDLDQYLRRKEQAAQPPPPAPK